MINFTEGGLIFGVSFIAVWHLSTNYQLTWMWPWPGLWTHMPWWSHGAMNL